ncbi:MAG: T9SS type A sorting domain-containing protein [Chlorobi bacterium]|nr:T9SS type A sorting domain-containing protein [Chlorobiota bacterium]
MNIITRYSAIALSLIIIFFIGSSNLQSQTAKEFAVMLGAEAQTAPPAITLSWEPVEFATAYIVFRKLKTAVAWPTIPAAQLTAEDLSWTDESVQEAVEYEYRVQTMSETVVTVGGKTGPFKYAAMGYISTGVALPPKDNFGTIVLLIDETMRDPLEKEIATLVEDLILEGWHPVKKYVERAETFDGAKVKSNKALILAENGKYIGGIEAVLLLGRVAVPYSGIFTNPPDGHRVGSGNHTGAWPADMYYGYLEESHFTDNLMDTTARLDRNVNLPGDGKFDMTAMNYSNMKVDLQVGRVDFFDLPAFETSETELLRKYLIKNHAYRTGQLLVNQKGAVLDNYVPSRSSFYECVGANGWRNYSALLGTGSVSKVEVGNWIATLEEDTYQFAGGFGTGGFSSISGVCNTANYAAAESVNAIFTMHFGSYSCDWDSQNNILRGVLATGPSVLTCAWVGRPHWYMHHMGTGEPIGYSTRLSQNNYNMYISGYFYEKPDYGTYPPNTYVSHGSRQVHVSLMGDPTLRMNLNHVDKPSLLTLTQPEVEGKVIVNWTEPAEEGLFYNVYRSRFPNAGYTQVNEDYISGAEFEDTDPIAGNIYYMVRPMRLDNTNSGSYYNIGQGVIGMITTTSDVEDDINLDLTISATPNPAISHTNISLTIPTVSPVNMAIYDINGNFVRDLYNAQLAPGTHLIPWNLLDSDGNRVAPAVYLIKITASGMSTVQKVVVMP